MKQITTLLILLVSLPLQAAPRPSLRPKIVLSAKVTDAIGGSEATRLTIGEEYGYTVTVTDAHLAANKTVSLTYTITVDSPESASPVSISGKLNLRATLPAAEGGEAATTEEAAALEGTRSFAGLFKVPEGLPEGDANISITLSTGRTSSVKFSKRYLLELD